MSTSRKKHAQHIYNRDTGVNFTVSKCRNLSSLMYGLLDNSRGNPGKTGYSGNMENLYIQKMVLPQSVFSRSVAAAADYYTTQLVCNSSHGLKQSSIILRFDLLLHCLFDDPSKFAK